MAETRALDKDALQAAAKAIFLRVDSMGRAITLADQCVTAYLAALQQKDKRRPTPNNGETKP